MKKIYILLLLASCCGVVMAQTTILTDTEWTVTNSIWDLADGSINDDLEIGTQTSQKVQGVTTYTPDVVVELVVNGDLYDDNQNTIAVSAGSTLIVYGNLSLTNSSSKLYGNVIVTGTTTMANSDILGDANLISLGSVTVGGGAAIDGDIYPIPPATGPTESSPIEDLLTEMSGDPILADIIESIPEVIEVIIENNTSPDLNVTWDGTDGSNTWSSVGNWLDDNPPSGDYSNITIQASQSPFCDVDIQVGNVVLEANSTASFDGSLFITGNLTVNDGSQLTVVGDLTVLGDIVVNSTAFVDITNLTLNAGATLTLNPGAQMTIDGDVVCDDNAIAIKNSVSEPATLIHTGTITDGAVTPSNRTVQVEWTYTNNRYFYIGHSSDYAYSNFDTPTVNPFNLYRYTGGWSKVSGFTGAENKLSGYAVKFTEATDVTISHTGELNNDVYTYAISGNSLLANPYQAYINVENAGFSVPAEADKTIYTATNNGGVLSYATYNWDYGIGVNGGSQYVAPGQAFWLVGSSVTDFTISPSARTHSFESGNGMLKSAVQQSGDVLRLKIYNDELSDEVAMLFRPDGELELTSSDSKKRLASGAGVPNLYTYKGGSKVAVGLYPEAESLSSLLMGYKFDANKELTIKATNINDFYQVDHVYLIDKVEEITIDLTETPEYTFMAAGTEESDRFELRFEVGVTTDLGEDELSVSDKNVTIFVVNKKAVVHVSDEVLRDTNRIIEVYNLEGQMTGKYEIESAETKFDLLQSNTVYIIRVNIDKSSYQQKVLSL